MAVGTEQTALCKATFLKTSVLDTSARSPAAPPKCLSKRFGS